MLSVAQLELVIGLSWLHTQQGVDLMKESSSTPLGGAAVMLAHELGGGRR